MFDHAAEHDFRPGIPDARLVTNGPSRRSTSSPGCCWPPATGWPSRTPASGIPVDDQGMVVEAIPPGTRLVCVTPSHQFPLGLSMSLPRGMALLAWAERHQAAILENDDDSEFRFGGRPIEPLRTLDRASRVVYVGSFSKTLLATLRLEFMVVPPSLHPAVRAAKQLADFHTPLPLQGALANLIHQGLFARHLRRMRGLPGPPRAAR